MDMKRLYPYKPSSRVSGFHERISRQVWYRTKSTLHRTDRLDFPSQHIAFRVEARMIGDQ